MIDKLDKAIIAWQAALFGRALYDAQHPFVQHQVKTAHETMTELLVDRESITLLSLGTRIVCGDETLPSSLELRHGIFGEFLRRGIDAMTVRRGLEPDEIHKLINALDERDREVGLDSAHLTFGHIKEILVAPDGGLPDMQKTATMSSLEAVWESVRSGENVADDSLCAIMNEISLATSTSSGSILPLATLKMHDEYTFVHTVNVAILASALGEAAGLSGDLLHDLTIAALLHDIGKASIPTDTLNKKGKLDDREVRVVQRHPAVGASLLIGRRDIPDMAAIVAFEHHMQITGGGYPRTSAGWRLSTASQIVQVADIYDALRTNRPYRAALTVDEALEIMDKQAGVSFDKALFDVFLTQILQISEAGRGTLTMAA